MTGALSSTPVRRRTVCPAVGWSPMRLSAFLAISVILVLSIGCLYRAQRVPETTGVVLNRGRPVTAATVQYYQVTCSDSADRKLLAATATDSAGAFSLASKMGVAFRIPVVADYVVCWDLCIVVSMSNEFCWRAEAFGPPEPPAYLNLECDLNSADVCKIDEVSSSLVRIRSTVDVDTPASR